MSVHTQGHSNSHRLVKSSINCPLHEFVLIFYHFQFDEIFQNSFFEVHQVHKIFKNQKTRQNNE